MTDDEIPEYGESTPTDGETADPTDDVNPEQSAGEAGEFAEVEAKWGGGANVTVEDESALEQLIAGLRNTDPHRPLDEIESPWDTEAGGIPRVYRGFQKLSGVEGTEAWLDIVLGMLETMAQRQGEAAESGDESAEMEAWKV